MDELIVRIDGGPADARRTAGTARVAIVRAATELFLAHGFQATSTDRIAASASMSKQTVYNQFGDKRALFTAVVLGVTATAEAFAGELTALLAAVDGRDAVADALGRVAHRWVGAVLDPRVLAVRRLVVTEAGRFPELAAQYHRRAPAATLHAFAAALAGLRDRGLLDVTDPDRAAADFAFVLFGAELDRGLFHPGLPAPDAATRTRLVDHALGSLLRAS